MKHKKFLLKSAFKKQLRYGLSTAIGFIIAYAWREPLLRLFNNISSKLINSVIDYEIDIFAALMITLIGVFSIALISKYLR